FDIPKFVDLFGLLCGTPVLVYQGLFLLLFCSGIFYLLRDDFLIGVLVVAIGGAFFFCEMISKEENAVLVSARFGIALIPIAFLLVATGMNGLFEMFRIYSGGRTGPTLAVAVFMGGLFFMSPLWRIYRSPNNFTNHSAYEESYAPTDWSVGGGRNIVSLPPLKKSDVPPFYFRSDELVAADGIIEYPMFIGDYFNPYYYYQVFHKKRVAVGYVPELRFSPLSSRNESVFGDTPIDYVLSRLPAGRRRRRFENMVPLTDAGYLKRKYTRWLLIVHKDPQKEFGAAAFPLFRPLPVVGEILLRAYGPPSYQDEHIVVWRIG
ncbi:MAG TPA: hypothetical protein P5079_11920, partial [Elusimicrobiota bacterium]|nr:hypothetical protein [Elusimicrobiota bacterium]